MANPTGKGGFKKGDPRINRKGRPKSFDALRMLAKEIAHEKAQVNGETVVINGHSVTVAEAILRKWATSSSTQLQKGFIEIAFGKVPKEVNLQVTEIDVSQLTDAQLIRLANGEDLYHVIANPGAG